MAMSWSSTAIVVASLRSQALRNRIQLGRSASGRAFAALPAITPARSGSGSRQIAHQRRFQHRWGTLNQLIDVSSRAERGRTSAMLPTCCRPGYAIGAAVFGLVANVRGFAEQAGDAVLRDALLTVFTVACGIAIVPWCSGSGPCGWQGPAASPDRSMSRQRAFVEMRAGIDAAGDSCQQQQCHGCQRTAQEAKPSEKALRAGSSQTAASGPCAFAVSTAPASVADAASASRGDRPERSTPAIIIR